MSLRHAQERRRSDRAACICGCTRSPVRVRSRLGGGSNRAQQWRPLRGVYAGHRCGLTDLRADPRFRRSLRALVRVAGARTRHQAIEAVDGLLAGGPSRVTVEISALRVGDVVWANVLANVPRVIISLYQGDVRPYSALGLVDHHAPEKVGVNDFHVFRRTGATLKLGLDP